MNENRREQRVVEGQAEINKLLKDGWHLDSVTPHSQPYERHFAVGGRMEDGVRFWIVGILSRDAWQGGES